MAKKTKASSEAEMRELEQAYSQIAGTPPKKKNKSSGIIVLICLVVAVALAAVALTVWLLFSDNWLKMPDVTVAGVSVNGMTKADAKELLQQVAQDTYAKNTMTVTVMDTTLQITAQQAAIALDESAAINAAYRQKEPGAFDLTPYMDMDHAAVRGVVEQLGDIYNVDLQQTTYTVEGTAPSLLPPEAGTEAPEVPGQTLVLKLGTPQYGLDEQALYNQILAAYSSNTYTVKGECTIIPPEMLDAQALYEKYLTAPVDAVMDPTTFTITKETYGYSIDKDAAETQLATANYGDELRIPFAKVTPAVTEESLLASLYKDVLGVGKTPYSGSDNNARNTNLRLACEALNGKILLPGEMLKYNETLGPRTAAAGYRPAPTYVGGETVDSLGGGICQVSSTLYNAVLYADLQVDERWPHSYISSYTDPGMDASVSWGSGDFKFTNNTNYPIKIIAYREKGYVHVQILGTDEKDYYVKMRYEVLGSTPYKVVEQEHPADSGYKDGEVLVTPYTGYNVKTYKCKYSKATDELISDVLEAHSVYKKRDKVVVKIVQTGSTDSTGGTGSTDGTGSGNTDTGSTDTGSTGGGTDTGSTGGGTDAGSAGGGTETP